jgi:hypothetical protein
MSRMVTRAREAADRLEAGLRGLDEQLARYDLGGVHWALESVDRAALEVAPMFAPADHLWLLVNLRVAARVLEVMGPLRHWSKPLGRAAGAGVRRAWRAIFRALPSQPTASDWDDEPTDPDGVIVADESLDGDALALADDEVDAGDDWPAMHQVDRETWRDELARLTAESAARIATFVPDAAIDATDPADIGPLGPRGLRALFCRKCPATMSVRISAHGPFLVCPRRGCESTSPLPVGPDCPGCGAGFLRRWHDAAGGRYALVCSEGCPGVAPEPPELSDEDDVTDRSVHPSASGSDPSPLPPLRK